MHPAQDIAVRAALGSLLAGVVLNVLAALIFLPVRSAGEDRLSNCALNAAVCAVAAYHYNALSRLVHDASASNGRMPDGYVSASLERRKDGIRYSDWLITLPLLTVDLYLIAGGSGRWLTQAYAAALAALLIALGAFERFGTDQMAPARDARGAADLCARVAGGVSFLFAFAILVLLIVDVALGSRDRAPEKESTVLAFILPWIAYGVVELVCIVLRMTWCLPRAGRAPPYVHTYGGAPYDPIPLRGTDVDPDPDLSYPSALSIGKDVAYAVLDCYSKFGLAVYTAFRAWNAIEL